MDARTRVFWYERLRDGVIHEYGQPRAVAAQKQVEHLARMLTLVAGLSPMRFPHPDRPVPTGAEGPRSHVDD